MQWLPPKGIVFHGSHHLFSVWNLVLAFWSWLMVVQLIAWVHSLLASRVTKFGLVDASY